MSTSKLTKHQKQKHVVTGEFKVGDLVYKRVELMIRFDDECGNGYNSFSMTGSAWEKGERVSANTGVGGCIHEILAVAFPQFAHLIKWHSVSTDGPMHYIANTIYHARETAHDGMKVGEPVKFEEYVFLGNSEYPLNFNSSFIGWLKDAINHGWKLKAKAVKHVDDGGYKFNDKWTIEGYDCPWYSAPFDNKHLVDGFINTYEKHGIDIKKIATHFVKAVTPNLEAARHSAVWPDATLQQLQDKESLIARLPDLLAEFEADIKSIGMEW